MRNRVLLLFLLTLLIAIPNAADAHPGGHGVRAESELRTWTNRATGERIPASFLFAREDSVTLERANGNRVLLAIKDLADEDRRFVEAERERIQRRIQSLAPPPAPASAVPIQALAGLLVGGLTLAWALRSRSRLAIVAGLLLALLSGQSLRPQAQSVRPTQAAPFDAYNPKVRTRWDSKYLYVESDGIPDHPLMKGIKTWQQQVPLPQPYYSENAWSIPLNPVPAAQPVSAKTALFTGAIALAADGVPIFNALNNRGVDSFSIGELDDYGGHCGRADDYHYHAAPLHIQAKIGTQLPIGYALDGYPLYGLNESDGKPATGLDEFNGHADAGGNYHYHSTKTYPYINGGMHGVVTVENDQIVPQSRAYAARPATSPLTGAAITNWQATGPNSWSLEYQINGQTYKVNYSTDGVGHFTYDFIDPTGAKRTESYTRRGVMSNVSAASYRGPAMAPESIVALFGQGLATATRAANGTPLPQTLNGTSVRVIDSLGVGRLAPLFFVSPGQVNYQIPQGTSSGPASVSLNLNGAFTGFGDLSVAAVAPGLFTADASGTGYPAAVVYRYRGNDLVGVEPVVQLDAATNKLVAKPLDLGPDTDTLFLVLFGTGARNRSSLAGVSATIGGADAQVLFAGAQDSLVGVDQINLRIPRALKDTQGDVNVALSIDGAAANLVKINLKTAGTTAGVSWSMRKLPDTGQTGHFGTTPGEDGDYTINPPSYTASGDGTVTDRVTGLQWQQTDGGEMAWDATRGYCDALVLAGKDDWRLPNVHELFSLLDHSTLNPAMNAAFTKTAAEYWWSSDLRSDDATRAWATNAGGGAGPHPKSETVSGGGTKKFHVRCVRDTGAAISIPSVYKDNGNGAVTDNRTGLVWQQADAADKSWDEAIAYCEALSLAGADDWRLPNIKELDSINDESRVRPSLNATAFPNAPSALYWASTTLINQTIRAWTVDFTLGIASYNAKTDRLRVRCVRGGN